MSNNPYQAAPAFDGGGPSSQAVLAKLAPPAIGLMVVGILNLLLSLYGIGNSALFMAGVHPAAAAQQQQFEELIDQGGEGAEFISMMAQVTEAMQGPVGLIANLVTMLVGGIIVAGALKMKKAQAYGLALTSAILAMIPCISNCCVVGLPIGIWALVVLMSADVKQGFR